MYFRGNCYLASPASSFEEKCPSMSMRIDSVFYPRAPLRMTARNQKRKHWGREWFKTNMAAFRASLHAPSSLVCSAAESDNSSEDELPFDENIPLAGYKEQDEEEDEEAIGDVESVSSQACCIRPRIKLKVAFDTRNVFLNLWSVYVFHTSSNHPLLRGSRRHDRSAVVFSEEIRRAERKKTSNNNIRLTVKRKRIFCCISFLLLLEFCKSFTSSNLRRRLRCCAIFVTDYRCTGWLLCEHWIKFDSGTTSELKSCLCRASVESNIN